ncbi:YdcF family protein [Haliscomenobacter sp.]|uniref:YdcF family protein n=1 Tax=Haliscomenobacter sp. TaxID=2717303 RepID=UPI003593D473
MNSSTFRPVKYGIFLLLLWIFLHLSFSIIDGLWDRQQSADLAVIMGNKVNEDGTLSTRLVKRVDCGLQLYEQGRVKRLMVSGGLGKEGHYEGDKMRDYLVGKGVPDRLIIVDNRGNNTTLSVVNTLQLQDSLQFKSVIVVSQYFHLTRSKMLFKKKGFKAVSGVSPWYFEWRDVYALGREFVGYYRQLLKP